MSDLCQTAMSNDTADKVQADLANKIDQEMAQSNGCVGTALNSLVTAFNKTNNTWLAAS